jgi:hypothetical protein
VSAVRTAPALVLPACEYSWAQPWNPQHSDAQLRVQVIHTLSKLGVPDALEAGPKTSEQLASELGTPKARLHVRSC